MVTTLVEPDASPHTQEASALRNRLEALQREVAALGDDPAHPGAQRDWRHSLLKLARGWASMPPERQAEFDAELERFEMESRARQVDDQE